MLAPIRGQYPSMNGNGSGVPGEANRTIANTETANPTPRLTSSSRTQSAGLRATEATTTPKAVQCAAFTRPCMRS